MKKLSLFLVMLALFCTATQAADLPRIAVYVTGDVSENEKSALATIMLAALVNSGRYIGIERSESFLAKLNEEHVKQRSGAIDDGQISALGKQFGVKYICVAAITPALGAFQVSARIIDVESAAIVFIGEANSPLKTIDDLTRVSDEVVMIMFGDAVARPRLETGARKKIGISVGAGGLFTSDFGGGSSGVAMPYYGGGGYVYFDAKYGQVTIAYSTGGGMWDYNVTDVEMQRSFLCFGVYAKYPEIAIGTSEKIKMFPLIGIDYEVDVANKLIADGHIPPPEAGELSALWGKAGAGLDFYLNKDVHIRSEVMYGARTVNAYERENARLGHGLTVRLGAGVQF